MALRDVRRQSSGGCAGRACADAASRRGDGRVDIEGHADVVNVAAGGSDANGKVQMRSHVGADRADLPQNVSSLNGLTFGHVDPVQVSVHGIPAIVGAFPVSSSAATPRPAAFRSAVGGR